MHLHLQISACHAMWGAFDYNWTPLIPPVTCVFVHENSKKLSTWDDNDTEGWYIGPYMWGHFHCYWCYISSTGGECISDIVQLFPSKSALSDLSSQDNATDAIHNLITIIHNPSPATPFWGYGPKSTTTVEKLADIFSTNTAPKQHEPYPPA